MGKATRLGSDSKARDGQKGLITKSRVRGDAAIQSRRACAAPGKSAGSP